MNVEKIIADAQKSVENLNVSPDNFILASFKTKGFSSVIS